MDDANGESNGKACLLRARCSGELYARVRAFAQDEMLTVSDVVRRAVHRLVRTPPARKKASR